MAELLIVDDDPPVLRMLERTLRAEGFGVRVAADGGAALASLEGSLPDLLILDVTMPGLDGLAVARRVRAKGWPVPILFLTARDALADRIGGFEAGADDYLVKPFAMEELVVRLRALLRRGVAVDEALAYRDLVLDPRHRRAWRGRKQLELTERESELLELLIRNAGVVVSRSQALRQVWADGGAGENVVDRYISYLRRKLGPPSLIETVRGVGFRLPK
jgi:two-component system, OmpR family, response regulator MprA